MSITHNGGVLLRTRPGGIVELPYLAAVCTPDGAVHPVPVQHGETHDDGRISVRGNGSGLQLSLELGPPIGDPACRTARLHATAGADLRAGLRVEVLLGRTRDPGWLVPGAFYQENRVPNCTRRFPRFEAGTDDPDGMVSHTWHLRADRCATPAVFARDGVGGAALVCAERGELGLSGVGLSLADERPALRLHFPYREEPVSYYGSAHPRPAETPMHGFRAGHTYTCEFDVYLLDADPHAYAPVLRRVHAASPAAEPAAWVSFDEGAELAAWGLYRWHYRPDPPVLLETAAFDREALGSRGDRPAMHVSWISGVPYAYALLRHARRVFNADYRAAAVGVLDHVAANLTPAGTFWGQWTEHGWNAGWTGDRERVHARTLADATLFMVRALADERAAGIEHPSWEHAVRGNLAVARAAQDASGHLGSAYHIDDGRVLSRDGAAGLSWVAALVEASALLGEPELLDVARRAGRAYAGDVHAEFLCGAPEDVDLAPTSEDGYAAVLAYTALAEADSPQWTDLAVRAAEWMLTFRYTYDVVFGEHTLLARYGFRTRGTDQASPSNQHLHSFGLVCLPEMVRLARITGDGYLLAVTRENLDRLRQFVARADGDFGAYRGMVTERFYQTDCFQAKGMLLTLSHSWCVGLLLYACELARDMPELCEALR